MAHTTSTPVERCEVVEHLDGERRLVERSRIDPARPVVSRRRPWSALRPAAGLDSSSRRCRGQKTRTPGRLTGCIRPILVGHGEPQSPKILDATRSAAPRAMPGVTCEYRSSVIRDRRVAESLGYDLRMDAGFQRQSRVRVADVVEPYPRNAGHGGHPSELLENHSGRTGRPASSVNAKSPLFPQSGPIAT